MNPAPLYQRLAAARNSAGTARAMARDCADPRQRHELECSARAADAEADNLAAAIAEIEALLTKLRAALREAETLKFRGAHTTLAIRHMEDAESRLQRELGNDQSHAH